MLDVMEGLRQLVIGTSAITDIMDESTTTLTTAERVYVNRVKRAHIEQSDTFHPPKMVVLRQAGGAPKQDFLPLDFPQFTVLCYGESDYEGNRVMRAVYERFTYVKHEEHASVCIYSINATSGAFPLVDPDIVWPAVSQGFSVMAHSLEAA